MPPPAVPPVDQRIIRIFLSVAKVSTFMKHTRRCDVRGFHQPNVDAGQDPTKPWRVFTLKERCVGRDGRRCQNHGLEFSVQLTDEQRVEAIYQLVRLEPFPYDSQPLLHWCLQYLALLHHLIPTHLDMAAPRPGAAQAVVACPPAHALRRAPMSAGQRSASYQARYEGWVSRLIPPRSVPSAAERPIRGSLGMEEATSCASFTLTERVSNVYCYTRNARQPLAVEVEAKKRDHMVYVSLCQPAILSAFGLKPRVRHLSQKLQIYDALGEKWFHSPAETLWLRLNVNESLILKTEDIRLTPGLENYVLKSLAKPQRSGSDLLPGYLASTRASINSIPAFYPVPPLTVMAVTIPEDDVAQFPSPSASSSSSLPTPGGSGMPSAGASNSGAMQGGTACVTKRQKRNDGVATCTATEIIDISSDEESNPSPVPQRPDDEQSNPPPLSQRPRKRVLVHPPEPQPVVHGEKKLAKPRYTYWKLIPRATVPTENPEVIVVSDDESSAAASQRVVSASSSRQPAPATRRVVVNSDDKLPTQASQGRGSTVSRRSAPLAHVSGHEPGNMSRSATAGPSTGQGNAAAHPTHRSDKGKGKMRAQIDDEDDSDVDSDATLC